MFHPARDGFPAIGIESLRVFRYSPSTEAGMSLNRVALAAIALALTTAATASAQDAAAGAKVYADQKCSLCHSIAGKGNAKGSLDGVGSKLSAADIRSWITDAPAMTAKTKATRKPVMKAYSLSKADADALVAYLTTLKTK